MATPRNENYNVSVVGISVILIFLMAAISIGAGAADRTSLGLLTSTYDSGHAIPAEQAETLLDRLGTALSACRDDYLSWRIRYRIGVIYFRAGRMAEALSLFERIADAPGTPDLIQACSLNMLGQSARLLHEDGKALRAFGSLAGLTEKLLAGGGGDPPCDGSQEGTRADVSQRFLRRLWRAALISRAEIHELGGDYAAASTEYERLLQGETALAGSGILPDLVPLAMDRLSQLYLQRQDSGKYLNITETLAARYPAYRRTPRIELERMCVRILHHADGDIEYPQGTLHAVERLVALLKRSDAERFTSEVLDGVDHLYQKYRDAPGGSTIAYGYAWMLDAAGRRDRAIEVIAQAFSENEAAGRTASDVNPGHTEILRGYAVIQRAVMLVERADYDEALQLLADAPPDADPESHPVQLAESMKKCIQTLKREVSRNEAR